MSWDLSMMTKGSDGESIELREWNYTHNVNRMIGAALEGEDMQSYWAKHLGPCWFDLIDKKTCKEAQPIFDRIVTEFEADPEKYEAFNPDNGWGSYKTLLPVLKDIQKASREHPSATWHVSS